MANKSITQSNRVLLLGGYLTLTVGFIVAGVIPCVLFGCPPGTLSAPQPPGTARGRTAHVRSRFAPRSVTGERGEGGSGRGGGPPGDRRREPAKHTRTTLSPRPVTGCLRCTPARGPA